MSVPFLDRPPTPEEVGRLRLMMSSFCDGSGQEREGYQTRPGWRDYERLVAEIFGGVCPENKDVFDVYVASDSSSTLDYGISIKSKQLARRSAIEDLEDGGRVYMELSNSPAKFWDALKSLGITEADFEAGRYAEKTGATVLDVVTSWHAETAGLHPSKFPGRSLDLRSSAFLVISYSQPRPERAYQLHSFDLEFDGNVIWKYYSPRCLRGYDPRHPDETLIDWYGLSGGQLKYYPRAQYARYKSERFELLMPCHMTVSEKAARYWPQEWAEAGGPTDTSHGNVAREIERLSQLLGSEEAARIAIEAAERIKKLEA